MTATKYGRIEVMASGTVRLDGQPAAHLLPGVASESFASALSDLTASTPTVDGPEGLTGPSAEGTWYGKYDLVPPRWQVRTDDREWHPVGLLGELPNCIVEARPVPLPVTEEVPRSDKALSLLYRVRDFLQGVRVPGKRGDTHEALLADIHALIDPDPTAASGMVTVQREGDEK